MSEAAMNQPGGPVAEPDVPGLIRRVRRTCDLNQRELAARLGVSQSTVARWETADDEPSLSIFVQLLALAGWSVAVVDESREAVRPMRPDGVRDASGRRRPAHLDVVLQTPLEWCWGRRVSDRRARGRCDPRYEPVGPRVVADDHPTEQDVDDFVAAWHERRKEQAREGAERIRAGQLARDPSCEDPCHCLVECFEVPGCLTTCECRCEGALFEPGGTEPVGWINDSPGTSSGPLF